MKKQLLTVALLASSLVASAQFATSNSGSSNITTSDVSGHSSFFVEYNSINPDELLEDAEDETATGFSLGFNKAFSIGNKVGGLPLFLEAGVKLTYAWATGYEEDFSENCYSCGDEYSMVAKETFQSAFVTVPINVMYKFAIPNTSIVLEPFAGLTFKGHILGQTKPSFTFEACCDEMEDAYNDELKDEIEDAVKDGTVNVFDKDDMGGKKYTANRFALGYQIGVNASFGKYYVGVSYGSDFSDYMSEKTEIDSKWQTTSITLGLRF